MFWNQKNYAVFGRPDFCRGWFVLCEFLFEASAEEAVLRPFEPVIMSSLPFATVVFAAPPLPQQSLIAAAGGGGSMS